MVLHTFDTAAAIKKLKEADVRENQAEAIVEIIAVSHAELATKADLELLRGDFKQLETKFDALETKFDALEKSLKATLDALKPKIILWGIVACVLTAGLSNVVNFLGPG